MRRWLLIPLLFAACRPAADRPAAIRLTDDAGRAVALAAPARRVVSLAPSSTELLFAIGAGDLVVGRTTWCKYPPAAQAVPVVGDGLNPNVEAVAARQPDLVVLYRSQLNETAATQFERIGIPTLILKQDRLEDVARDARLLGRATGHDAAGDSVAAAIESVAAAPPPRRAARVAFVVWDNPPTIIGAGSFLDQIAVLAGGENVFHDIAASSAVVSLETIAARNPDLIVTLTADSEPAIPPYSRRAEWRVIPAVKAQRFLLLPEALFGRPGPRSGEAVAELRRRLGQAAP